MRASFEETVEILMEAAAFSELDPLAGVSETIMLGKLAPAGTGVCQLVLDESVLLKHAVDHVDDESADDYALALNGASNDYVSPGTPLPITPGASSPSSPGMPTSPLLVPFSPLGSASPGPSGAEMSPQFSTIVDGGRPTSPMYGQQQARGASNARYAASSPNYAPSSPAYSPSSPAYSPSSPAYSPSSPAYSPSSPAYSPSSPAYSPSSPAYSPSSPAYSPSSPAYSPSSPAYSPSSPAYSPSSPAYSPSSPAYSPSSPAYSPSSPAYSPSSPAYSPSSPAYSPSSPTYAPNQQAKKGNDANRR